MNRDESIASGLKEWFYENRRTLPWRDSRTPYRVLVSEVMLQQTQVIRVVPYFFRWMDRFPTLSDLAKAAEDEVMHLWEGLGYYSRARSLHKAARYILEHFKGEIPSDRHTLLSIPGIGPYTAGAILSFGFNLPTPAIDANVIRVIARLYDIGELSTGKIARSKIELAVSSLLRCGPHNEGSLMEAMIELGALICTGGKSTPQCRLCPLSDNCLSYQRGTVLSRPVLKPKAKTVNLYRVVFVFKSHAVQKYLVIKRGGKKIMSGLYEFPFIEMNSNDAFFTKNEKMQKEIIQEKLQSQWGINHASIEPLQLTSHGFTQFNAYLYPFKIEIGSPFIFETEGEDQSDWVDVGQFLKMPFSSGHKKIASQLDIN